MLNQVLIKKLAQESKIAPLNIIREYLEMEVLYYISQSGLASNIIFYGGTALRLAYSGFRFSEDLDFLMKKDSKEAEKQLNQALQNTVDANKGVFLEEIKDKRNTLFGLLHITNELLKHPIRLKVEISKKKNGIKSDNLLLISDFSNKEVIFNTILLESLYKLKIKAIKGRNMPRDWFDYWYICQKMKKTNELNEKFPFNTREFKNELKRWLPQDKWLIIDTIIKFYI